MENKQLKEQCIQLYLQGKNYTEISKVTGYSRTYITNLIKNDERVMQKQNTRIAKVYKRQDDKRLTINIPSKFIKSIGISQELTEDEFVDISVNNATNEIVIKKHSK